MPSGRLKTLLLICILLVFIPVALAVTLDALLHRPSVQRYLLARLSVVIGYDVCASDISLDYRSGLGIDVIGLEIQSPETAETMSAVHAVVSFDFSELFHRRIVPRRIALYQPTFDISFRKDATGDIVTRGMPGLPGHILTAFPSIVMEKGSVRISDPPIALDDVRLEAEQIQLAPMRLMISLSARMQRKGGAIPLSLTAAVDPEADGGIPFVKGSLESDAFPLDLFPWTDDFSSKKGKARASLKFRITPEGRVETDGRILAEDVRFRLKSNGRKKDFPLSYLALDFESAFGEGRIEVPSFRLSGPGFYAKGVFRLDARVPTNPSLFLEVESSDIDMETAKKVCPTPLLPSWIEGRLYPDLKAGKVRLERLLINGRPDQIMALEKAANAEVFAIRIDWQDVVWKNDVLPWRFERVPGTMEIRERRFRISGVTGRFGASVIEKGGIETGNVFRSGASFNIAMAGRFDTEQLLVLRNKGLIPEAEYAWFDRISSASGKLQANVKARFKDDWKRPRLTKGDFQWTDCTLVHQDLGMPVGLELFHFEFDKKGGSRFQGRGRWGASAFDLSGQAFSADDIRARVSGTAVPAEVLSFFLGAPPASLKFRDPVQCRFDLEQQSGTWAFQGEMGVKGITLQTDRCRLNVSPEIKKVLVHGNILPGGKVQIRGAECSWGDSVFHLSGSVDTKKDPAFLFDVASPGVRIADLGLELDETISPPQGVVSGRVRINGVLNGSSPAALTGKMEGQGISFALKDRPISLQEGDFSLDFDDSRLRLASALVTVGEIPLHAQGEFKGRGPIDAELELSADELNLTQAVKALRSAMPEGFSGPGPASRIGIFDFKLHVKNGQWRNLAYGPLEAAGRFRDGTLRVDRLELSADHGMITLMGKVTGGEIPDFRAAGHVQMRRQPVEELLRAFRIEDLSLEGPVNMDAVLLTRGANRDEFIRGLSGHVNLLMEDGRITRSNVMMNVLGFLSLQKIWKERPPDMSREGLYFNSMGGHLDIENGVMETENLALESPAFNAVARGSADLAKKRLDANLGVQPLGTIDFMVSRIPVVGYILTGDRGALLIYHFDITGPLMNPAVRYTPLENLPSGIGNFFKRIFLTPERLISKLPDTPGGFTPEEIRRFEEELLE